MYNEANSGLGVGSSLQAFLKSFAELGGVAENICQREGEYGRGIFPVDSLRRAKIMTPKNLFVNAENLILSDGVIAIKDKACYTLEETEFLESYYNNLSWGNNGNSDAAAFLTFIASLPEAIKKQLLGNGFVDSNLLASCDTGDHLLKRFISERSVSFEGQSVLAPVWEFVNHSSFVPPLRIAPYGVETPPIEPSSEEILFKYSGKNSPISMWRKYGFACDCIVAYSVPFNIDIGGQALCISCSGQLGLGPGEKSSFSLVGDILSIKSLPVGCISISLPQENFKSILSSAGLSADVANRLFPKIREVNLKARRDLIDSLHELGSEAKSELYRALICEIELIENSSIA